MARKSFRIHKLYAGTYLILCLLLLGILGYYFLGEGQPGKVEDRAQWSATSSSGSHEAHLAFDGDLNTRWTIGTPMQSGMFFQLDLGQKRRITRIELHLGNSLSDYPRDYQIAFSVDQNTWKLADTRGNLLPPVLTVHLEPVTARYLKIIQTGVNSEHYWSIHELSIYQQPFLKNPSTVRWLTLALLGILGLLLYVNPAFRYAADNTVYPTLLRSGFFIVLMIVTIWIEKSTMKIRAHRIADTTSWSATASHHLQDMELAFDGWHETFWTTGIAMQPGMFFELDLGEEKTLNKLFLNSRTIFDALRGYRVEVSVDGTAWKPVFADPNIAVVINRTFRPVNARFIRIVQTGETQSGQKWSIHELQVYSPIRPGIAGKFIAIGLLGILLGWCYREKSIRESLVNFFREKRQYTHLFPLFIGGMSPGFFSWMISLPPIDWKYEKLTDILSDTAILWLLCWCLVFYIVVTLVVWMFFSSAIARLMRVSIHDSLRRDAYTYLPLLMLNGYWWKFRYGMSAGNCIVLLLLGAFAGIICCKAISLKIVKVQKRAFLAGAILFCLCYGFYVYNLHFFEPVIFTRGTGIFEADMMQIADGMRQIIFRDDMGKHLLFSVVTSPLVQFLQCVFPIRQNQSIILVLAMISAANILFVCFILRNAFLETKLSLLFSCLYAFFFSNLVIFSIPETYALSNLMILLYFWHLVKSKDHLTLRATIVLSFLSGLASLFNPPLLSLMVIHLFLLYRALNVRRYLLFALFNVVTGIVVFCIPNIIIHGWRFYKFYVSYVNIYSSFRNLIEFKQITTVLSNFFFFSIISPVGTLKNRLSYMDFPGYFESYSGSILLLVYAGYMIYTVMTAIKRRTPLILGIVCWMLVMVTFYIYFCPPDSILFSCQILFPLLVMLVMTFKEIRGNGMIKYFVLGAFSLLLMIKNSLVLYSFMK